MAKEIGIDRPVGELAQLRDRLRRALRLQGSATHRAQAACRTDRSGKVERANARHRSQYQRVLDTEKVNYASIGPHSCFSSNSAPAIPQSFESASFLSSFLRPLHLRQCLF